ncbi:hypothetical protein [Bacillus sp. ISL-45]|uniref:hypothetical protein n=1 Tax=Bacillus sp. ISL-45 TaxID=2819128 RepID=UPI001BE9753D|nr:hypothetical protein [Bacillus sp. ISL-45]MBT2663057.1 hypothetical protein [Bacillus sp. ISL-45]
MSEDNMLNNSNKINKIVVSNSIGDELSLEKVTDDKLEVKNKYKEVFSSDLSLMTGNVSQTALQVANQGMTLAQIAKQAPNGLFTATANPSQLSKFANGTTTTMVRDASGHLVEHAGFAKIGLSASVNPAVILSAGMQGMSVVSGTYYLHKINNQIRDIDAKLEKLLNIHHDTSIGRLIAAKKGLSEIANREFVDTTDLSAIRNYKKTADEIHEEYKNRLKRRIEEEELDLTIKIAFEANKLSLVAEVIEIGKRMKNGDQIEFVNGLIRQLKQNYTKSFYLNIDLEVEKIYSMRQQQSSDELVDKEKKLEKSREKLNDSNNYYGRAIPFIIENAFNYVDTYKNIRGVNKVKEKVELENKNLSELKKGLNKNKETDGIDKIIDKVVELPNKEIEILYIPTENNKQRVFVAVVDE